MSDLLAQLSDHRAAQEQLANVTQRYDTARALLDEQIKALTVQWEANNAELLAERADIADVAAETETKLRADIVNAYLANPSSKTVAPGLSVRVNTSLKYDPDSALEWATTHKLALALDRKAFETFAKANPAGFDFVKTIETPSAVIKL